MASPDPLTAQAPRTAVRDPDSRDQEYIRRTLATSEELEQSEDARPAAEQRDDNIPGVRFLTSFMKATLFSDLFCHHADMSFDYPTRQQRVLAMKKAHPHFYVWCRNTDYVTRIVLMAFVAGAVGAVAIGSIWKLFLE